MPKEEKMVVKKEKEKMEKKEKKKLVKKKKKLLLNLIKNPKKLKNLKNLKEQIIIDSILKPETMISLLENKLNYRLCVKRI